MGYRPRQLGHVNIFARNAERSRDWYEDLLRWIKSNYDIHIHGFSPPELDWFAKINKISLTETLIRLRDAGLGSIPGGGAEILTDHARDTISPKKCTAAEWLEVMRQGHLVQLKSSATMMYGHAEDYGERVEHLLRLRDLQDETGGFTAFICWSLQPNPHWHSRRPPSFSSARALPNGRRSSLYLIANQGESPCRRASSLSI